MIVEEASSQQPVCLEFANSVRSFVGRFQNGGGFAVATGRGVICSKTCTEFNVAKQQGFGDLWYAVDKNAVPKASTALKFCESRLPSGARLLR